METAADWYNVLVAEREKKPVKPSPKVAATQRQAAEREQAQRPGAYRTATDGRRSTREK